MEIKSKTEKGTAIIEGKKAKHLFEFEGKTYWRFDSGIIREVPHIEDRKKIIIETHEKLLHRVIECVKYEIKKIYYWFGLNKDIQDF